MEPVISSSLCRFRVSDEHLIADSIVKAEISRAFDENRCFEFYLDRDILGNLTGGLPPELFRERFIDMRNGIFDTIAKGDQTLRNRYATDIRLSSRLIAAIALVHRAVSAGDYPSIQNRRFVIVKELPGVPTICHVSNQTTVISHVGQGPPWQEISTIYLGLKTFDAIVADQKKGGLTLFDAFRKLLAVEERAIETGFAHSVVHPPEVSLALMSLVDAVIEYATAVEVEEEVPEAAVKKEKKFTDANRKAFLKELDARVDGDELNFDYERCIKAIKGLERLARRYKTAGDAGSLREIVRLLVAASGHDIHEVRDRANVILDRIFAPKEYDAPLATRFITVAVGTTYDFEFDIPDNRSDYVLRIYRNGGGGSIFLDKDIDCADVPLIYDAGLNRHRGSHRFESYGHCDFVVLRRKGDNDKWISSHGTSGRVNVIPDVRGEIILEIFVDIHGHTGIYWRDQGGHPGLVYNEHGQVIRLGNFADLREHLEDIKQRYCVTAIYLLGVQKRGTNREDWAPEATSPSPFSPQSLVEIEPFLGGDAGLKSLVARAHELDIKVIVDIIPHINRKSTSLGDDLVVFTYDGSGNLVARASTDGRYGSWNDGKLLNYRKIEIWEWMADSICALIDRFDIDGIRFDSAHAVPIMMKKNNYPFIYKKKRNNEELVEGTIVVNDREDGHMVTTGYYDSACRDLIAVPFHYYLMLRIERTLREHKKDYFINIAECFWGHERFLTRTGLIPYNSTLFKICENIIHGKTDVHEIYHVYDSYFPSVLSEGTELLGILGNHDERRALNTFGHRGLRAAVALTCFMSNVIMDYEGSAEGEGWKVYLDNIYVNWNQFEYAAHRSLDGFYLDWYRFHREARGQGYLVWANNSQVAAAAKFVGQAIWLGAFNFADSNQNVSIQFDNPKLPIPENTCYRLSDPLYSDVTGQFNYYTGRELKISRVNSVVAFTDRVKLLRLEPVPLRDHYRDFIRDSFIRLCEMANTEHIASNFFFGDFTATCNSYAETIAYIKEHLVPLFWEGNRVTLELGLKRTAFYVVKNGVLESKTVIDYGRRMAAEKDETIRSLGEALMQHNRRGSLVFLSAEADPFSKSGGLANVVYELPRELVRMGESVCVITGYYRNGDDKAMRRFNDAVKRYNVTYTGINVRFYIMGEHCEVGVHHAKVEGIDYYLLDHHEFFDGLYWGITSAEKLRRRIAFARASVELILAFDLQPTYTFTNDAFAGLFNGIVRCDAYYAENPLFRRNTFLHIVHNGGWQYFDAYHRWENGFDLFNLFNLPAWRAADFVDPVFDDRLNCMATGIRFATKTITVSPSYARQIEYACDGLEHILKNVIGISNAIGADFKAGVIKRFDDTGFIGSNYGVLMEHLQGNPLLNEKIRERYPEILAGPDGPQNIRDLRRSAIVTRVMHKLLLQAQRGLRVDPDIVLFCMIHRVSEQKGFQLLLESSEGIVRNLGFQGIIGGAVSSGDKRGEDIAHGLWQMSQFYPDMINVNLGFQDVSIPLMACDLFLMPSMHEPGGISQLEALAMGDLVVARATGGLRDTVFPIRVRGGEVDGNGFLFSDYNSWSFYDAMERAMQFFKKSGEDVVHNARVNAERSVYFWERPAREYLERVYDLTETIRLLPGGEGTKEMG